MYSYFRAYVVALGDFHNICSATADQGFSRFPQWPKMHESFVIMPHCANSNRSGCSR